MEFSAFAFALLCLFYAALGIALIILGEGGYKIFGGIFIFFALFFMIAFFIQLAVIPNPF